MIELEVCQTESVKSLVNPAIYYHPEGFTTSGFKLMGRQAAGESFLRAYCRHSSFEVLSCYTSTLASARDFEQKVRAFSDHQKSTKWIQPQSLQGLAEAGCLFTPGPGIDSFAWQRRHYAQRAYSLCGITHTTASERVMAAIGSLLIAPVQPWDALICTSTSVKGMVETLLQSYQEYLSKKFNSSSIEIPLNLPVIPLGVDLASFMPTETKKKAGQIIRQKLGINKDSIVFLFMGRLSFHAKAHPYPMFVALEQAAQKTGKHLVLILAGWFANKTTEKEFQNFARIYCPSVSVIAADGRIPDIRENIWYAADIFTSLSDNIQETFGLTPIEAKAAGLPVVVSDWDGYRETVRHNQDGFLIPTAMPMPGNGIDFALRHAVGVDNYDHYIGKVAQTTAISVEACATAYTVLIENPELRFRFSQNALSDVQARFDWPLVINQYQLLWAELSDIRNRAKELAPVTPGIPLNPLMDDPYRLFQNYPTVLLNPMTKVSIDNPERGKIIHLSSLNQMGKELRFSVKDTNILLSVIEKKQPVSVGYLQNAVDDGNVSTLYRTIGWLLKMGVLKIYSD